MGVFADYGLPSALRSDNGPPFAGRGVGGLSRLAVRLIKAGVMPERIAPGKPQQNGRHERMHLTLKQETASPPAASLGAQIARFESFQESYNHDRRTRRWASGRRSRTIAGSAAELGRMPARAELPGGRRHAPRPLQRRDQVGKGPKQAFSSETLIGEPVGLRSAEDGHSDIWYGPIRLASVDHRGRLTRYSPSPKAKKPVDLLESESALPTTPQVQQQQQPHEQNQKLVTHVGG